MNRRKTRQQNALARRMKELTKWQEKQSNKKEGEDFSIKIVTAEKHIEHLKQKVPNE